ncbi:MAG: glycoside hydrolase [Chloroflexi bacterium]|nr:glycoside hydrolase [Chloroflexota bacterium]
MHRDHETLETSQPGRRKPLSRRGFLRSIAGIVAGYLLPWLPSGTGQAQDDPKRIYIAPDDHTDYFWTADEDGYRQAFIEMLDYYLDLADTTENEPPEFQSRWNCDGSFWLWTYEQNKSEAEFNRLIERIRDGHISAPLNALVVCLGGAPTEAILRGMYYPGKLERRYGIRFSMAIAMENQTLSYGLISLWAGSGARYSWKGICNCDTAVAVANREQEIYWAVGQDNSRILMKWNSLLVDNQSMGGYAEARNPFEIVDYVDTDPAFRERYPYHIIGAFGKGWDDFKTLTDEFVRAARQKTNDRRQVIVSNETDFFVDFEASYGNEIPTVAASFGNEWDLYCAAMAENSAQIKRAVEKLRAAEALATLIHLDEPGLLSDRTAARDQAWMDLGLFWEHNWGVAGRYEQFGQARIAWQRRLADEINAYVDTLHSDAIEALGAKIRNDGDSQRFFVFNPLSWVRTDVADFPYSGQQPVFVVDLSTGLETPSQVVSLGGEQHLRILAEDLPAIGYKVFEIRSGEGTESGDAATVMDNTIENSRYVVTVAERGAITSLIDKAHNGRQLVREINGRFINDLGPGGGTLEVENAGPVSVTLLATANGPLDHTSRITLYCDADRIDIRNEITQNFDEILTWGFGFALDNPDVWHEEVGAVIRARLTTEGGHYAPTNGRYDWLTLNHFADISEGNGAGVTLSNADCYFMKLGNSTPRSLDTTTPLISALAGGRVVNGNNGIPNQGGDSCFLQRFALRTHDTFDPVTAMRFALEHQNPLVTGAISGGDRYPATTYSLVEISDPNVILWALKPADDTSEIIARLWNLSSSQAEFSFEMREHPIREAMSVSHIETPINNATVEGNRLVDTIRAHQMKTFALTV